MNYTAYLMKFLAFIPSIAGTVEMYSKDSPLETKLQHATDDLNLATALATSILPEKEAAIASTAGVAAQNILAYTVEALHNANNPPGNDPAFAGVVGGDPTVN